MTVSFTRWSRRDLANARRALHRVEERAQIFHTPVAGDAQMCWRRWGSGTLPPLVLLHGGNGTWMHWARNVEKLATRFTVWVPDMPGFGDSGDLSSPAHDPERQLELVQTLDLGLSQLIGELTPFDVAGFSFGALIGAHWAATSGASRIHNLALLGTAGHGGQRPLQSELADWRPLNGWARLEAHARNLATLMLQDPFSLDAGAVVIQACCSLKTRYRSKASARGGQLPQFLDATRTRLLLVWGTADVTANPLETGPALLRGRINGELRLIPDAGHWVQYERCDAVNTLLLDWLDMSASRKQS